MENHLIFIISRARIRLGLLLALLVVTVFLQGCFLDRLMTLRSQACALDEHFGIDLDPNVVIELHDPVLLEKDMYLILGAPPTTIASSSTGSTMHYLFQRVPTGKANEKASVFEEFSLDFNFIPVDGQLRLSEISGVGLPSELLLAASSINTSSWYEAAEFACQTEINPFTRSMLLPLDQNWFSELPSRDELVEGFGSPDSTLDEGNGLVYRLRLRGSDAEKHTANLVIWFDETGERPLTVEADFSRYQVHVDLLTAQMEVHFRI